MASVDDDWPAGLGKIKVFVAQYYFASEEVTSMRHLEMPELESGLETIRQSPRDRGVVQRIVRRPQSEAREELQEGTLDPSEGLVGDNWKLFANSMSKGGPVDPETQLTLMNARAAALLAQSDDRWALAGDQLFVDLDLSEENLPPGTRLSLGSAVIEITSQPHTGCAKFAARFGSDALKFVNSPVGKQLHLRGIYAKVIQAGTLRLGDEIVKL